jgi:hypothetical protein
VRKGKIWHHLDGAVGGIYGGIEPAKALAIIDDVVLGKVAAAELATIHGIPPGLDRDNARAHHAGGWHGPRSVARGRRLAYLPGV